jgi:hypothetical protein
LTRTALWWSPRVTYWTKLTEGRGAGEASTSLLPASKSERGSMRLESFIMNGLWYGLVVRMRQFEKQCSMVQLWIPHLCSLYVPPTGAIFNNLPITWNRPHLDDQHDGRLYQRDTGRRQTTASTESNVLLIASYCPEGIRQLHSERTLLNVQMTDFQPRARRIFQARSPL